jgi:hypothetical protein
MSKSYVEIAARAGHRCEYCRAPEAIFNLPFEVEHIEPRARGGHDDASNLALSCRACNVFKSHKNTYMDETSREVVALFHPRRDRWDQHFRADLETGRIEGLTAIGRATIACLRMNATVQAAARLAWAQLQLFP